MALWSCPVLGTLEIPCKPLLLVCLRLSGLYQCSAPRCSAKHIKVPCFSSVFASGLFFFFLFVCLFISPQTQWQLQFGLEYKACNACILFLLCLTEEWDLNLKKSIFQALFSLHSQSNREFWADPSGCLRMESVCSSPLVAAEVIGFPLAVAGMAGETVACLLDRFWPQAGFGRLNPALASSRTGLEPGLALLEGLEKVERNPYCRSLRWQSRDGFHFA